ncbi:DUF2637 domain-containing protein [Actinomadura citrea]|uniref:DUF2637 domain-containing protein n=1 Tax=Actinomadura citrea TaxID=46158 RepID=UPI002E284211|nr:DUF2637 domain-containing protein [Actinomadura citrea]
MSATDALPTAEPESVPEEDDGPVRDWWVVIGMTIAAVSAAVASFTGLYGLATVAGWPVRLAWLLPITIDAHAMTSARVWLASTTRSAAARRFARTNALGAIAMSITGNAAYHAIGAGLIDLSWPIVVLVGAVPAAVLGLTAHLHALRSRIDAPHFVEDAPTTVPEDESFSRSKRRVRRPPRRTDDELMDAARFADAQYRQIHGRPITRDALRTSLRISTPKATELRRRLNDPGEAKDSDGP